MGFIQTSRTADRQWKMLFIYNSYRLVTIIGLFFLFWFAFSSRHKEIYFQTVLSCYLLFGLFCFYLWFYRVPKFELQVLLSGSIDILVMSVLISAIGHMESGLGIILYVTVAILSMLTPGRIAIYFASVASTALLLINIIYFLNSFQQDLSPFFTTGIYGAGFFATAMTTWYLANRIRYSELLAEQRSNDLISILRVGEYFVDQYKNGLIYVEPDGNVRLINHAVHQYFNLPKHVKPTRLDEILPELNQKYLAFVAKRRQKRVNAQTLLADYKLRVEFFSVSVADQISVLITLEDIALLEQQAQQFKLAALGRFSASIAHELRNPLGVISHAVQLMGDTISLDDETLRLKTLIENNCNRMNRVIKNVLQLTRQQFAQPEKLELVSFLKIFKHEYCLINHCEISIIVQQNKKRTIFFDKSQLNQVLIILCDNAMQHGIGSDGMSHITLQVENITQGCVLHVSDSGVGIPYSKREMIFEPFFTTTTTGNGMGLFIAKDLCEMNRCRLILEESTLLWPTSRGLSEESIDGAEALDSADKPRNVGADREPEPSLLENEKKGACFTILFNHRNEIQL